VPDRFGPRGVIAILIPQQNSTQQPEYDAMRVPGVSHQIYRFVLESQDDVAGAVLDAVPGTHGCWPDMIIGGNSLEMRDWSIERQGWYAAEFAKRAGDVPFVLATDAMAAALRTLGAKRIAIWVPLYEQTLLSAKGYYEDLGFEVPYAGCLGVGHPVNSINIGLGDVEAAFEELDHDDVDVLVHIGASIGIGDMIAHMEAKFGKPFLSVNQVTYWYALRTMGIDDPILGYGRLPTLPEVAA
jgi:maleate isomerase